MSDESYMNGYDDGKSDCDIEWKKDYEKLEQQLKEAEKKIKFIKEYTLDRWVGQGLWYEMEKEYLAKYKLL